MKSHSLAICLLSTACFLDVAETIKLTALNKDSWQDFFGEDTHIQKASLPKLEKKELVGIKVETETEFQKTMNNAKNGSAIFDFIVGIIMLTAAFPIVWMNERR